MKTVSTPRFPTSRDQPRRRTISGFFQIPYEAEETRGSISQRGTFTDPEWPSSSTILTLVDLISGHRPDPQKEYYTFASGHVPYFLPNANRFVEDARKIAKSIECGSQAEQANKLISAFEESFARFGWLELDIDSLSPISGVLVDDGSVLFEWIFDDFRFGFVIEQEADQSHWYLVSNSKLDGLSAAGNLSEIDLRALFRWLFYFVRIFA